MNANKTSVIPRFPVGLLAFALILTATAVCWLAWNFYEANRFMGALKRQHIRCVELRGVIVHLDEVLTMSARMAAATGDLKWEERYKQHEQSLDDAIKEATRLAPQPALAEMAAQTDAANLKLVAMETRSFELVRQGQFAAARLVLFSPEYEAQKQIYAGGIGNLLGSLDKLWNAKLSAVTTRVKLAFLSTGLILVVLISVWFAAVRTLTRWRSALATTNTALAGEIVERRQAEAKAEVLNKQLIQAAHRAGMAEVATGVLHNVGNVLNSVNISSTLVADGLRKSKLQNLARVAALLREHAADLGGFLTNDPKGKLLPGYLRQLAEHLATEQATALVELSQLQKNIGHIKDVVSMQQGFARVSGLREAVPASELLEDALQMDVSSIGRPDVQVIKDFQPTPPVVVDKHKALQLLVNLIRNAKQSCAEANRATKQVTLRIMQGQDRVQISVSDNGVGIPSENLARIFAHGFTTKKDGHGFGLHSGAIAAKEMGGDLKVHSDGVGKGATFTVELPVQPPATGAAFS